MGTYAEAKKTQTVDKNKSREALAVNCTGGLDVAQYLTRNYFKTSLRGFPVFSSMATWKNRAYKFPLLFVSTVALPNQ